MISLLTDIRNASPLQRIHHPLAREKRLNLWVKRDDLIHPLISGNKWRKLKYNLLQAQDQNSRTVISFGGAFSNHIHALAAACQTLGLKSVGIIRGEPNAQENPTLSACIQMGMSLHFVSRDRYKTRDDESQWSDIRRQYADCMFIPEGGSNSLALKGVAELLDEIDIDVDHMLLPCASGGTLAGLLQAQHTTRFTAIAALKGKEYLQQQVTALCSDSISPWCINDDYHFGGYAKFSPELLAFCQQFFVDTGIPSEPIYSGKMFYALMDLIKNDYFSPGENIVALHTGGLQGIDGLRYMNKIKKTDLHYKTETEAQ